MSVPSGPPVRVLPPLTSSLQANVAHAFGRKRPPVRALPEHAASSARDIYASVGGDDDDEVEIVEELPAVTEARARNARVKDSIRQRVQSESGPRTYTLGELVETIRARKQRARTVVESGDVDGAEPEIDENDILFRATRPRDRA